MIVNAWICFSLGGYVYVLFIFVYVFCSLQNFLQFLDAQMFYQALQISLCQNSPWHLGSLTPIATTSFRSLFLRIKCIGTGQNKTPASPLHEAHGRETTDTHKLHRWWCRHRIGFPKSYRRWGHFWNQYLRKSIPSSCTQGSGAFIWVCLFLPTYKYLFSFPCEICMIHPARTGILQVKTWIKSNTSQSSLKVWRDLRKSPSASLLHGRNYDT